MKQNMRMIGIGEILLRLTPPNYQLISAAHEFEAHYGGSEANICMALANMGVDCSFFSVVPDHSIGRNAVHILKSNNIDCSRMILSSQEGTPHWRMGLYFLEKGFGIRSSKVVYDRKNSAFAEYDYSTLDLNAVLEGYDWLHVSGIVPALNDNCKELTLRVLKTAKEKGMSVSFDGNFRSTLWSWEEARDFCTLCLPYVDVLFGIEPYHLWKDEHDHTKGDIKDGLPMQPTLEAQQEVFKAFVKKWPNLKYIARHVRYVHSGSENSLKAYLWHDGRTYESLSIRFQILDRVGGGDAFAAGLLYGIFNEMSCEDMVNFAVASSALKHTIHGDALTVENIMEIKNIMNQNFEIKR